MSEAAPWPVSLASMYRSCPPRLPEHWQRCEQCGAPMRWDCAACTGHPRHVAALPRPLMYATITGTRRNLVEMAAHGWRLLTTPDHLSRGMPPWAYALDNGAFSAWATGAPFDAGRFREAVAAFAREADFVVAPDIVAGGLDSLRLSESWLGELAAVSRRVLVPVQDGMGAADVAPLLSERVGLFVGGSTAWKEATMGAWCALARQRGAWSHVGRVNTRRRLALVVEAGADSCDGTSPTRFAVNAAPLAVARDDASDQRRMFGGDS